MNYNCSIKIKSKKSKFIGCDGKKWSNKFIKYHIKKAVEEENYEWAQECQNELKKRKKL